MTKAEIEINEMILNEGKLISREAFTMEDGLYVESFLVEYDGEKYSVLQHNGEWVYLIRC